MWITCFARAAKWGAFGARADCCASAFSNSAAKARAPIPMPLRHSISRREIIGVPSIDEDEFVRNQKGLRVPAPCIQRRRRRAVELLRRAPFLRAHPDRRRPLEEVLVRVGPAVHGEIDR